MAISPASASVDQVLKESGQSRADRRPLAGKITSTARSRRSVLLGRPQLVVLLFDQSKPDATADTVPKATAMRRANSRSAPTTKETASRPASMCWPLSKLSSTRKRLLRQDRLKNLYNDPTQNAKVPS